MTTLAYVNVTTPDGVLLGRFPLEAEDLTGRALADQSIGWRVREQFPIVQSDGRAVLVETGEQER